MFLWSSHGPGAALLEITKTGDAYAAREIWKNNRMKNKFNSSVRLWAGAAGLRLPVDHDRAGRGGAGAQCYRGGLFQDWEITLVERKL